MRPLIAGGTADPAPGVFERPVKVPGREEGLGETAQRLLMLLRQLITCRLDPVLAIARHQFAPVQSRRGAQQVDSFIRYARLGRRRQEAFELTDVRHDHIRVEAEARRQVRGEQVGAGEELAQLGQGRIEPVQDGVSAFVLGPEHLGQLIPAAGRLV